MAVKDQSLKEHLVYLLDGDGAHANFEAATVRFPEKLVNVKPPGAPHSAWQLLEHMRIAQRDILEFSRNPKHVSPEWPEGYWPAAAPADDSAWSESARAFRADLETMKSLVSDPSVDLFSRIPHGEGQTVLREALLVADHNAYHLGQLIMVRRLLGAWKNS
ncbi:MAG: DinB family protein [Terriglobia bacterium]